MHIPTKDDTLLTYTQVRISVRKIYTQYHSKLNKSVVELTTTLLSTSVVIEGKIWSS